MSAPRLPFRTASARLGFFDGVRAFFGGIGFIVARPPLWGWALVPMFVATLFFVALAALTISLGSSLAASLVGPPASVWTEALAWVVRILSWIVGLFVAFLVAVSVAQPLSGSALEVIARRQEVALGGHAWPDQPFVASTLRSLRVTFTALAISVPLLLGLTAVTILFPPASVVTIPLKLCVTGLAVAYDFLDYPLGIRGAGVRSRFAFIRRHFAAVIGFGGAAAALLLVPGLGLLLLPFGVAGASRLVVESERRTRTNDEPNARRE